MAAEPRDATPFVPARGGLKALAAAGQTCRGCALHARATQAVFGEGPARAALMLVGETPGDREDLAGRPFVGPAGHLLDRALAAADVERAQVYLTNAVKHFKFEERGKRRLHKKPSVGETRACQPWLDAEIARVRPAVILCLGATALFSIAGPDVKLTEQAGRWLATRMTARVLATPHPSAILRIADPDDRAAAFQTLVEILRKAARAARAARVAA